MSQPDVLFPSCVTSQLPNTPEEQRAVQLLRELGEERVVWLRDPENPERSAFVARSPATALQWICQKALKKEVIEYVRKRAHTPDGAEATPKRARRSGGSGSTTTNQTKQHMKALENAAKLEFRACFHNSQEATEDVKKEDAFTRERAALLRWVGQQPEAQGAGKIIPDIVKRGLAVGNSEAMRDMQLILRHWRAYCTATPSSSQARALAPALQTSSEQMIALRDGSPTLRARYHFHRYETAEHLGAGLAVARRYHAARLRQEYEDRVAREVQPERNPPITRKRKTEIQAELYLDIRPRGVAVRGDAPFDAFLRSLKHGKRWRVLEQTFGAGFFALLPKSRVSSTFVERTLTDDLFVLWVRMLEQEMPLVVRMAREITSLVELYAEERAPPPYRLYLENDDDDVGEFDEARQSLADLLEPEDSRVEEVGTDSAGEGGDVRSDLFLTQAARSEEGEREEEEEEYGWDEGLEVEGEEDSVEEEAEREEVPSRQLRN